MVVNCQFCCREKRNAFVNFMCFVASLSISVYLLFTCGWVMLPEINFSWIEISAEAVQRWSKLRWELKIFSFDGVFVQFSSRWKLWKFSKACACRLWQMRRKSQDFISISWQLLYASTAKRQILFTVDVKPSQRPRLTGPKLQPWPRGCCAFSLELCGLIVHSTYFQIIALLHIPYSLKSSLSLTKFSIPLSLRIYMTSYLFSLLTVTTHALHFMSLSSSHHHHSKSLIDPSDMLHLIFGPSFLYHSEFLIRIIHPPLSDLHLNIATHFNLLHTAIIFHHFFTVSLWAQNLPFQKILSSTLVCFCLSDWSHGRLFTGLICSSVLCFSSIFSVLVIPKCGKLSWPALGSTFRRTIIQLVWFDLIWLVLEELMFFKYDEWHLKCVIITAI